MPGQITKGQLTGLPVAADALLGPLIGLPRILAFDRKIPKNVLSNQTADLPYPVGPVPDHRPPAPFLAAFLDQQFTLFGIFEFVEAMPPMSTIFSRPGVLPIAAQPQDAMPNSKPKTGWPLAGDLRLAS